MAEIRQHMTMIELVSDTDEPQIAFGKGIVAPPDPSTDLVFQTAGVEYARISTTGVGTGFFASVPLTAIDTDSTFAANSDTRVASQKAVKTAFATKQNALNMTLAGSVITFTPRLYRDDFAVAFGDSNSFMQLRRHTTVPSGVMSVTDVYGQARGVKTISDRLVGVRVNMIDDSSVVTKTISGAANNGSGLIRVTCTGHTFATNDYVGVYGVGGTTEANGWWQITVIDANTFDLLVSTFTNAYTSGGSATNRPMATGVGVTVVPGVDRGGLTGTAVHADDLDGFTLFNGGTGKATDGYYIGRNSTNFPSTSEFISGFTVDANVDYAIRINGAVTSYGIDLSPATFGSGAIKLPNAVSVFGRNAANTSDVAMFQLDSLNELEFLAPTRFAGNGVVFNDGIFIQFGSTNGTKIGTSTTMKFAFHGATAVAQRAGAAQAAVATTASTQTTPWGFSTQAQADAIVTLTNEIRAALVEKGLIKGAA